MLRMSANCTKDGKPLKLLVFGLSHQNLKRLKLGQPIIVKGEDVHAPGYEILIFSGETEQSMVRDFHQFIGPETVVNIDPKLRD
jgi:hypothetical protein